MSYRSGKEVFAKTVFGEARGEPVEGQKWVAEVIKNRALINKDYWGGNTITGVCLMKSFQNGSWEYQFECWKNRLDIDVSKERKCYENIKRMTDVIYDRYENNQDVRADHYNNPSIEGYPRWTENCDKVRVIGKHQFYRSIDYNL